MKWLSISLASFLLVGCTQTATPASTTTNTSTTTLPSVETDTTETAVTTKVGCDLPVKNSELFFYTSSDGQTFGSGDNIYSKVSVPHIFYDTGEENYLVSFQIFEDPPLCDTMAYLRVSTAGEVLSEPTWLKPESDIFLNGFDPTLLSVNDQVVLAYTVRPQGLKQPCISIAVGEDITQLLSQDEFIWCSDNDDEAFMDPSAIQIGDYVYLYTPSDQAMASSSPKSYYAKVDPITWEIVDNGEITGLQMFLLGSITATNETTCPYRFYGTYQGDVQTACTSDGVNFTLEQTNVLSGADPGATQSPADDYALVIVQ